MHGMSWRHPGKCEALHLSTSVWCVSLSGGCGVYRTTESAQLSPQQVDPRGACATSSLRHLCDPLPLQLVYGGYHALRLSLTHEWHTFGCARITSRKWLSA